MGYSGRPAYGAPVGQQGSSWWQNPTLWGTIVNAGAGIYGAYNQNQANQANTQAQAQQNAMMQQYISQLMMGGQNPYAGAMGGMAANFSSQGSGGFSGLPQGGAAPGGQAPPGAPPNWMPNGGPGSIPGVNAPGFIGRTNPQFPQSPSPNMLGAGPNLNISAAPAGGFNLGGTMQGVPGQEIGGGIESNPFGGMLNTMIPVPGMPTDAGGTGVAPWAPPGPAGGPQPQPTGQGGGAGGNQFLLPGMAWNPTGLGPAPTATGAVAGMPTLGESFNVGQDGLLQSMRRDVGLVQDPEVSAGVSGAIAGNTRFDNSELFRSLGAVDDRALQRQVTALQGSAGSFGQRFGTAGQQAEAQLRGDFTTAQRARDAQIAQQSFEAAQGRAMQGLGLGINREQFGTQAGLQNAQLQQGAAGQLAGLGMQQYGMGMQNNQFNAANQQQAGLANQQLAGQYGLAQFGAANDAGRFNAQNTLGMYQYGQDRRMNYDQMAMQALAQAQQAQMGQNQYNAGLVGMLGGLPLPTQMPSAMPGAIGQAGMMAMLYPWLRNM